MNNRASHISYMCRAALLCILFLLPARDSNAQFNSAITTNRCYLSVEKMMDMGFVNNGGGGSGQGGNSGSNFVNSTHTTYNDLLDTLKSPEFHFRIRTNENFNLSLNTFSPNDSTDDHNMVDSLLQVKVTGNDDDQKEEQPGGFEDITSKPKLLYGNNNTTDDRTFNVKYRAKPGTKLPPEMEELDLLYTASHP